MTRHSYGSSLASARVLLLASVARWAAGVGRQEENFNIFNGCSGGLFKEGLEQF